MDFTVSFTKDRRILGSNQTAQDERNEMWNMFQGKVAPKKDKFVIEEKKHCKP